MWNPATYDEAKKSDNPAFVYCASKTLAEHAAWDFVKAEKVSLDPFSVPWEIPVPSSPPPRRPHSLETFS